MNSVEPKARLTIGLVILALFAFLFSIPAAVIFYELYIFGILSLLGLVIQIYMVVTFLLSNDRHKYSCFNKCAYYSILIFDLLLLGITLLLDFLFSLSTKQPGDAIAVISLNVAAFLQINASLLYLNHFDGKYQVSGHSHEDYIPAPQGYV